MPFTKFGGNFSHYFFKSFCISVVSYLHSGTPNNTCYKLCRLVLCHESLKLYPSFIIFLSFLNCVFDIDLVSSLLTPLLFQLYIVSSRNLKISDIILVSFRRSIWLYFTAYISVLRTCCFHSLQVCLLYLRENSWNICFEIFLGFFLDTSNI